MQTAAIIAEYNPFHNGHAYHIAETRKRGNSHVIAIMSGNFVQRGSMAIADKFERAKCAILGGADLVLELPLPWCMSSAHDFAVAGVEIANATGVVDSLSFGCETPDENLFMNAVEQMNQSDVQEQIKLNMKNGLSYPQAVTNALITTGHKSVADFLLTPNNMLAFEYCNALRDSKISPCCISRMGVRHDSREVSEGFASASEIRKMIYSMYEVKSESYKLHRYIPPAVYESILSLIAADLIPVVKSKIDIAVLSRLRTLAPRDFRQLPYVSNGLENRLFDAVRAAETFEQACDFAKNKQVTHARIRRTLMMAVLSPPCFPGDCVPYLRVLAMNNKGIELLRIMKQTASLPIIVKHKDIKNLDEYAKTVYDFNMSASDLYSLCLPVAYSCGHDAVRTPFVVKEIVQEE